MPYLVALLLACGGGAPAATAEAPAPVAARPAPPPPRAVSPAELKDLLATGPGHVRVTNVWATWCGPCMAEIPMLRATSERFQDVELLMVNVDVPTLHEPKVKPTIAAAGLTRATHLLLDSPNPGGDLKAILPGWRNEIPVTLVQRANGEIVAQWSEPVDQAALADAIAKAR